MTSVCRFLVLPAVLVTVLGASVAAQARPPKHHVARHRAHVMRHKMHMMRHRMRVHRMRHHR